MIYPKVWTNLLTTFLLILKLRPRLLIRFFFTLIESVYGIHYILILMWRLLMNRVFQEVIKVYMAVRHSSLLPDTEGQFSHWDCAFLKINLQLITYRPAVNMHMTYNYSILTLLTRSLLAWWSASYSTAPSVKLPGRSLMACSLLLPRVYTSALQLVLH